MKFRIHRGTSEIGGSCVEIWTDQSRIVLDLGLPLVKADKTTRFESNSIHNVSHQKLIKKNILPNIEELYTQGSQTALILSHAHQDHYGLIHFIDESCPVFMGKPTQKLIEITNTFSRINCQSCKSACILMLKK